MSDIIHERGLWRIAMRLSYAPACRKSTLTRILLDKCLIINSSMPRSDMLEDVKTSVLRLEWKRREGGGGKTQRDFLDFVVDDKPLSEIIDSDLISPLGWFVAEENVKSVRRLLLEEPSDFPDNRRSLYVRPECGGLGCGAVSAVIEQIGNEIIWRDFGYESNYLDEVYFDGYESLNSIVFDKVEYEKVIKSAL